MLIRVLLVSLMLSLGFIESAHACSCQPIPPVDEEFERSGLVVLGKVTRLELTKEAPVVSSPSAILVTIEALEVFKGALYKGKYDVTTQVG